MNPFQIHEDISKASTIDTSFYTSEAVFLNHGKKIFEKGWHYLGDEFHLPQRAYAYPQQLLEGFLDEPLVMVRDDHNQLNCFSNVCTHRGNILVTKAGPLNQFRCGYHGRVFNQAGNIKFMPEFDGVQNFPCQDDDLTKLPLFNWGPLVFTSLQFGADPLLHFKDMMDRMSFFDMSKLRRYDEFSKDYYLNANWALYVENYLEGFHIPFVHESLAQALDFTDYETELFYPYSNLQLGVAKSDDHVFELPPSAQDHGKAIAAYYFWVFPNMMFNFYPWGLSLNIVEPLGFNKTKIRFICYIADLPKHNKGAGSDLDKVEMEDEEIVLQVQKGVQSRFYNKGRYSVLREKGPHHFHRLLVQHING
jgi:choline monooxygenase